MQKRDCLGLRGLFFGLNRCLSVTQRRIQPFGKRALKDEGTVKHKILKPNGTQGAQKHGNTKATEIATHVSGDSGSEGNVVQLPRPVGQGKEERVFPKCTGGVWRNLGPRSNVRKVRLTVQGGTKKLTNQDKLYLKNIDE